MERMERFIKVAIVVVFVAIAAYIAWNLVSGWQKESIETARKDERVEWEKRTKELMEKLTTLEEELASIKGETIPQEKLEEVFGPETDTRPEKGLLSFQELEQQIRAFFAYLDEQDYVQAYELKGGTYQQFQQVLTKLSKNPPNVTGETASLYNLYRNMAHFFRVLGKKRVYLIRDILQNEAEILESVMQTFYLWLAYEKGDEVKSGRPSLKEMYAYSGFFLDTLAGKSYLLRRDSKIRLLTTYYSILILDKANDENLNSIGIDIRPHIEFLRRDFQTQIGVIHQKQYLLQLEELADKYKLS